MNYLEKTNSETHNYYDGAVQVTEFNFTDDAINDAEITLTGRYPIEGYTVNDVSLALMIVESGEGTITIKDSDPQPIDSGNRILVKPGEPYFLNTLSSLAFRYIATPAWTPGQSRILED